MFSVENKENDVKSQEGIKLLGEPVHQKVRRSVLKEFDPFVPDSPLPQKVRQPITEEDEIFEDAETSLPGYLCPINKSVLELNPSRGSYGTRESLLIPELKDYRPGGQLINLNETLDLSYSECVEDLSQLSSSQANVTSSDDFEFNYKPKARAAAVTSISDSADQEAPLMDTTLEDSRYPELNSEFNYKPKARAAAVASISDSADQEAPLMDTTLEDNWHRELNSEVGNTEKDCQKSVEKNGQMNIETPCNSDEEAILKRESPKKVVEANAPKEELILDEIQKIGAEHRESLFEQLETGQVETVIEYQSLSDATSLPKESHCGTQAQAVGEKTELKDARINQSFGKSLDDSQAEGNAENDDVSPQNNSYSHSNIDVNEILFIDTQLDRTCDATFLANDPLKALDPLNVENDDSIHHNSGDNPLERNVGENVTGIPCEDTQINISEDSLTVGKSETISLRQNEATEGGLSAGHDVFESDNLSASKGGHMYRTFEDHKADDANSHVAQREKQTEESACLKDKEEMKLGGDDSSPEAYINGSSEESQDTNKTLVEPVASSIVPDSQIISESSRFDDHHEKSAANEDKSSKAEDIALNLPDNLSLGTGGPEPIKTFDANDEGSSSESKRAHDKSVLDEDKRNKAEAITLNFPENFALESGVKLNKVLDANCEGNSLDSNQLYVEFVADEDKPSKAENITEGDGLNNTFDDSIEGTLPESPDNNETLRAVGKYQFREVNHSPTARATSLKVEKPDSNPLSSSPVKSEVETMEAGADGNTEFENLFLKEVAKDRFPQSSDNNDFLDENDALKEDPDENAEGRFEKGDEDCNMTVITHSVGKLNVSYVTNGSGAIEWNIPERADGGIPEDTVGEFKKTITSVAKPDLASSENLCMSPLLPVEGMVPDSCQLWLEGGEKEVINNQIDASQSDVMITVKEESPEKGEPSSAQLDEIFYPNGGKTVSEPNLIQQPILVKEVDVENRPKDLPNTKPSCKPNNSDQSVFIELEDNLNQPLNVSYEATKYSDIEGYLPETVDLGSPEKIAKSLNLINKTFKTIDDEATISKSDQKDAEPNDTLVPSEKTLRFSNVLPVNMNVLDSHKIKPEDDEEGADKNPQAIPQGGQVEPPVVNMLEEEPPEKEEPPSTRFNKTFDSSVQESVLESHPIKHQNFEEMSEDLPNNENTLQPLREIENSGQPALVETELVKVEGNDSDQPLNASYVTINQSDVELNFSGKVEQGSSDVINETFETSDEILKSKEKRIEPNVSAYVTLIASEKKLDSSVELKEALETPLDTKASNSLQIKTEDGDKEADKRQSANTQSRETMPDDVNTVKETLERLQLASSQPHKNFDSNAQETVSESQRILPNFVEFIEYPPKRHQNTSQPWFIKNSDHPVMINAMQTENKDESVNQPLDASVTLASDDVKSKVLETDESPDHSNETLETSQEIINQKCNQHISDESGREMAIDKIVNEPPSMKTSDNDTESSADLNKTFEAAAQITPKLNRSNNEDDNEHHHQHSECRINPQQSLNVDYVGAQSNFVENSSSSKSKLWTKETQIDPTNSQTIPASENGADIKVTSASQQLSQQNSSFPPETGQSESERAVEALARSLNQTIDFEEPAIVEDIDSPDTTGENLNVTVENVISSKEGCCDKTEYNQNTENYCDKANSPSTKSSQSVHGVISQSSKVLGVEQKGNDDHDSNGAEEKIRKDMMKTETTAKNATEAENIDNKSIDKSIKPPNRRIECRPNIRSLRNKTQVITNPLLLKSEQMKTVAAAAQASDENEKLLSDYKRRNDQLRNDVSHLEEELDKLHEDNTKKDQCILSYALGREADRNSLIKYRKLIKAYEEHIIRQKEELALLKTETDKLARHFTSTEMAFSELFEKYEKAKLVVQAYRKNEAVLVENIRNAENQLAQLDAKCNAMQDKCDRDLERARQQIDQEEEHYKQNISKLQAMVKRLEIKASSLETSLKQKTEECQALAALCDDITGNQPS